MSESLRHWRAFVTVYQLGSMTEVSRAASMMGRRSVEARIQKWGKREFARKLREWGKLGGRPKGKGGKGKQS